MNSPIEFRGNIVEQGVVTVVKRIVIAVAHTLSSILSGVLILGVRLYQFFLSPIVGRQCRFSPTCSHYFIGAVKKYGPLVGSWKGVCRICRCHPFHPGGDDPP